MSKIIITKKVFVKWNPKIINWYENKGYIYTEIGKEFEINVEDLTSGSHVEVQIKCDCPDCKNPTIKSMCWKTYNKSILKNGKYYCKQCASKERISNGVQTKLKKSISFEEWCINNNRQDILDRWDYKLNDCKPSEICYSTHKKVYFKCSRGLHESELKDIHSFTNGEEGVMYCKACNSFAQWGIDNINKNFLDEYWDYKENKIDPWVIPRGCDKKVWIICQENKDHGSYFPTCKDFSGKESRCPICNQSKGEIKIGKCLNFKNIYYIPQKEFKGLFGLGGGNLSYDFYSSNSQYNLLIEYDGEFHYKPIRKYKNEPIKYAEERLKQQQEHDRLKTEYCDKHNIKLLRIPYWDYDNIEKILKKELNC